MSIINLNVIITHFLFSIEIFLRSLFIPFHSPTQFSSPASFAPALTRLPVSLRDLRAGQSHVGRACDSACRRPCRSLARARSQPHFGDARSQHDSARGLRHAPMGSGALSLLTCWPFTGECRRMSEYIAFETEVVEGRSQLSIAFPKIFPIQTTHR